MEMKPNQVDSELDRFLDSIGDRICFSETMKVYAPTCNGDCLDLVKELAEEITDIFGGSTIYDVVTGCWLDSRTNKTLCEPTKVIEVAHTCTKKTTLRRFGDAIAKYATASNQHSLSIKNGKFYITETPKFVESVKGIGEGEKE